MGETDRNHGRLMQKAIDEHKETNSILRKDMRKFIEKNIKVGFNPKNISPAIKHTIHDRPLGWIKINESGKVIIQSTKGYEENLNCLSFADLTKLFNHILKVHA